MAPDLTRTPAESGRFCLVSGDRRARLGCEFGHLAGENAVAVGLLYNLITGIAFRARHPLGPEPPEPSARLRQP